MMNTTMNNGINFSEMTVADIKEYATDMLHNIAQSMNATAHNVKAEAGESADEYFTKAGDSINAIQATFLGMFDVLGLIELKNDIMDIMYYDTNTRDSKRSLLQMAKRFRKHVEYQVDLYKQISDEDSLKKVAAFEVLLNKGTAEEYSVEQNIFDIFISSTMYIIKKANKKVRKLFKIDVEGSFCNKLAERFKGVKEFASAVGTVAINAVHMVLSIGVATVLKVAQIIYSVVSNIITFVLKGIKGIAEKLKDIILKEEDFDDFDDEIAEELDEEFEEANEELED